MELQAIWWQPMVTQEATELSLAKSLCSFQAEHKGLKLWIVSREVATEVNLVAMSLYLYLYLYYYLYLSAVFLITRADLHIDYPGAMSLYLSLSLYMSAVFLITGADLHMDHPGCRVWWNPQPLSRILLHHLCL